MVRVPVFDARRVPVGDVSIVRALVGIGAGTAWRLPHPSGRTLRAFLAGRFAPFAIQADGPLELAPSVLAAPLTLPSLALRDGFRCAYCDRATEQLRPGEFFYRDHVVPRSRGGEDEWINLVLSCARCNTAKGSRLPTEAGLELRVVPWTPTREQLARLRRWHRLLHAGEPTLPTFARPVPLAA